MKAAQRLASYLFAVLAPVATQAQSLSIGSAAPPIKVAEWISGQQPKLNDGRLHVLVFWSTWSVQSRQSIPTLTELAHKYGDKVDFSAISVYEQARATNNAYIEKVRKFVEDQGRKMNFDVAADGFEGAMAKTWMQAANQKGVPAAFLVGKDGKILWIGHPMIGLGATLDSVLAGTYSAANAASGMKEQQKQSANAASLQQTYNALLARKDYRGAALALDKVIAAVPSQKKDLLLEKYTLMLLYDEAAAQKLGADLGDGLCRDDGEALNTIAWAIVDPTQRLKKPDLALALRLAERSVSLLKGQDSYSMDTLAFAQFKLGRIDLAIQNGTKAVNLANATQSIDPQAKKDISAHLALYKRSKKN